MEDFTQCGHNTFNFTETGFFTLVNKKGESVYDHAFPLFEKLMSHLAWMLFWLILILMIRLTFPLNWVHETERILMSLIFVHLFLFGCRLTTLLIQGGIKSILFPPLWTRLTRKMQKGNGIELLKRYSLENHPGLLVNLAWTQYHNQQRQEARDTLRRALEILPEHPVLLALARYI